MDGQENIEVRIGGVSENRFSMDDGGWINSNYIKLVI